MYGYLDPGNVSMVVGAVAAGVAGAGVAVRSSLGRLRRKKRGGETDVADVRSDEDDTPSSSHTRASGRD